jgi:predicted NAD-dependent protein-ADP-ribosyltransferase YbiA (DUF1768 family)
LGQKSASLFKDYITPAMNYLDITPVTVDGIVDEAATVEKVLSMPSINKALSAKNFNKENFAPNPYVRRFAYDKIKANRNTPEGQSALEAQLAFAAQYYVVKEQNKILLELTSNIDFNTSSYRINTEFYATTQNIKVAAPNFAAEGFNRILESSVVAPFNILEDTEKLIDQVWDFFSLEEIKEHLYNVKESYGKYWGRDESVTNYNQLVNSFMLSFIQNMPSLKSFQDSYGISSGLFDLKSANNLRTRFDKLFSSTEDKALKRFAENNLILNNFSPISIPDSNYFYPGMITNEKDVDTVNAAQKAFSDGLNHPNPEVSKFFRDLANGVLVSQGFNIKYRSIQNFIPLEAKSDLMIELSIALKKIKIGLSKPVEEMTEKDSEDAMAFMSLLESTTSMHANLYWPSKDNDFIPTAYMKAFPNFKEEEAKAVTTEKKNSRVTNQDDLDEAKLYAQQSDNDVPSMDELDEEQLITRRLIAKGKTVPAKTPATSVSTNVSPASNKINIYAGGKGENAELSNFAVRPFSETWDLSPLGMDSETLTFNTVEGAFQATKILYSADLKNYDLLPQFQKSSGAQAKALGQKIKGLDTEAWDSNSSVVMKDLIKKSFEQNPDALAKLIATGNATLTHTQDKSKWAKEFPRILMEVRAELRDNNLEGFDFEVTKCIVD